MNTTAPIQHGPGCMQFRCPCGVMTTFAPNSHVYTPLKNLHQTGPRVDVGDCPECGQRHWRGMTRPPNKLSYDRH